MLYRPEAFEPLTDKPWDEERVRARIREIVADADGAYTPEAFWPADEWDGWNTPLPLKSLYVGAAGVIWALGALRRRGYDSTLDVAAAARRNLERWREEPDYLRELELPSRAASGLLTAESGILVVAWRLSPSDDLADALYARVLENMDNEAVEVMWGAPGTLLAARAMHDWTGDERWADAWRRTAQTILAARDEEGLWPTRLYGRDYRGITPPHGLVGNVGALLDGGPLLDEATRETLRRDTVAAVGRAAVIEDGLANWAQPYGSELEREDGEIRLQWCAGAPGIVIATAAYLDEELLLAGAELGWRAGPHTMEKGPSICHGTSGNGFAFLKVFERTGDERWLERARRFAVHALEQVERRGRGRYALWTGDLGVALYADACLEGRAAYPVIDSWD
jgi:Lanthionine synthetase C-like protein